MIDLRLGDCLAVMRTLPANSIDAIVCDPPYGLGFMGKAWDALPPGREWAEEVMRVAKPGAHLIAFGGQRTIHRLATAIEDGGFEIRDQIGWVYWTGFPKSLDVSKAIDAAAGAEREVIGPNPNGRPNMIGVAASVLSPRVDAPLTAPATDAAREWAGWGTALKPCIEPAVLARKPLIGTVAANIMRHRTGALNIDACRYALGDPAWPAPNHDGGSWGGRQASSIGYAGTDPSGYATTAHDLGRWPANLYACPKASRAERERGCEGLPVMSAADAVDRDEDSAGMANPRAGAGRSAENGVCNGHPTVKPVQLMRWLARLVTPPGGVVLDPFMGSGTTGVACALEGFDFVGIEREAPYHAIAQARVAYASGGRWEGDAPTSATVEQMDLLQFARGAK